MDEGVNLCFLESEKAGAVGSQASKEAGDEGDGGGDLGPEKVSPF